MDSTARQRLNVNSGTDFNEKSPSKLEGGTLTNDAKTHAASAHHDAEGSNGNTGKDPTDPPLTKSRRFREFKHRIRGGHLDSIPTILESAVATVKASYLNLALVFVILSWVSHFVHWRASTTFILSFLALIPLEKQLQFCSHQSMLYLGKSVGDLVNVTLMNAIEAILAILLLTRKCSLKLLQSTIIGVILLQLLLVPGVMFLTGGSRVKHQELHASQTQLNQTLMTVGVMCFVIPAAFFAGWTRIGAVTPEAVVSPEFRDVMLKFSRGMAIIMLCVYIASRIYLVNPPGEDSGETDVYAATGGHEAFAHEEEKLKKEQPVLSPWWCFGLLVVLVALIGVTAEWLVESIEEVREGAKIEEEWFGLVLLPLISFSGDGVITFSYAFQNMFFHHGKQPHALADAKPIDLSIQFALFWTPLFILIGWWIGKPLPLLFDIFEVVILVAACFVVNYITADAKTNWAEGFTMISLFAIIALVAWFYPGQEYMATFFGCVGEEVAAAGAVVVEEGAHALF